MEGLVSVYTACPAALSGAVVLSQGLQVPRPLKQGHVCLLLTCRMGQRTCTGCTVCVSGQGGSGGG